MKIPVEAQVHLKNFKPRHYQLPIMDAIENKGYKRVIAVLPRRAGKDITAWNLCIRAALRKVGVYLYVFPTYSQARKVIWQSLTNDGQRFLDFIHPSLITSLNSQEMKVVFKNGSLIQLVGSDNIDSHRGTNPSGCIFSEYAWQDPRAYTVFRPALNLTDGFSVFISTPNGKNHFYDLWSMAQQNKDQWYSYLLTVDDTLHISRDDIERERATGEMSDDMIQQEYYCSFEQGASGSYYSKYLQQMKLDHRLGDVPWDPSFKVHTAWDLGMRDATSIIFFQNIGATTRIIDCYQRSGEGLEHYIQHLQSKPYNYGKHIAPHDIQVRELGTGMSRLDKAAQLGINFVISPNLEIMDGVEAVRTTLPRTYIDENKCAPLVRALNNYRKEWDHKRLDYRNRPLHDWSSHFADAVRYMALSIPKTKDTLSSEDLDRRFREATYGNKLPGMFGE